jgi:hypothetical protein
LKGKFSPQIINQGEIACSEPRFITYGLDAELVYWRYVFNFNLEMKKIKNKIEIFFIKL